MDDLLDKMIRLLNETLYRDPPIAILAHNDTMARFIAESRKETNIHVEGADWQKLKVLGIPVSRYDALAPASLAFVGRTETRVFDMNKIDKET